MLVRELSESEAADPRKRQHNDFWNFCHRLEESTDVRLGIWNESRPPWATKRVVPTSPPLVVFGWPGASQPEWISASLSIIVKDPSILGSGHPESVVLARSTLPAAVLSELRNRYQYVPTLLRQQEGWWFIEREPPAAEPTWRSPLALLPEGRADAMQVDGKYLLLVDVDDYWLVLSEGALRIYETGAALEDAASVRFAQWNGGRRAVYSVMLETSISNATVRKRFGAEAARRARSDAKSVVVSCKRER